MMIDLLENIIEQRPREKALLGLDVGTKTIGLSVCDPMHMIATPLQTLNRTKFSKDIVRIAALYKEFEVGGFVLGYPLHLDGSEGRKCQSIRDFAFELVRQLPEHVSVSDDLWVALWDERLSTASVEDFVDKFVDIKRRKAKEQGIIDKLAAQVILQGALDYIERMSI